MEHDNDYDNEEASKIENGIERLEVHVLNLGDDVVLEVPFVAARDVQDFVIVVEVKNNLVQHFRLQYIGIQKTNYNTCEKLGVGRVFQIHHGLKANYLQDMDGCSKGCHRGLGNQVQSQLNNENNVDALLN